MATTTLSTSCKRVRFSSVTVMEYTDYNKEDTDTSDTKSQEDSIVKSRIKFWEEQRQIITVKPYKRSLSDDNKEKEKSKTEQSLFKEFRPEFHFPGNVLLKPPLRMDRRWPGVSDIPSPSTTSSRPNLEEKNPYSKSSVNSRVSYDDVESSNKKKKRKDIEDKGSSKRCSELNILKKLQKRNKISKRNVEKGESTPEALTNEDREIIKHRKKKAEHRIERIISRNSIIYHFKRGYSYIQETASTYYNFLDHLLYLKLEIFD